MKKVTPSELIALIRENTEYVPANLHYSCVAKYGKVQRSIFLESNWGYETTAEDLLIIPDGDPMGPDAFWLKLGYTGQPVWIDLEFVCPVSERLLFKGSVSVGPQGNHLVQLWPFDFNKMIPF